MHLDLQRLLTGVSTDSFDDGIRIDTCVPRVAGVHPPAFVERG